MRDLCGGKSESERVEALLDSVPVAYVVLDNTEEGSGGRLPASSPPGQYPRVEIGVHG